MTSVPLPGAKEAETVAKVGVSVLRELRKASELPAWPDLHEALLELHAILREWCAAAAETSRYAELLESATKKGGDYVIVRDLSATNAGGHYVERIFRDGESVLSGRVPPLVKVRGAKKRRAARRGLRTILGVYEPELLDRFEQATTARFNWVRENRKYFDRWFDEPGTSAELERLRTGMARTRDGLEDTANQLREFITATFPLRDAPENGQGGGVSH